MDTFNVPPSPLLAGSSGALLSTGGIRGQAVVFGVRTSNSPLPLGPPWVFLVSGYDCIDRGSLI